MATKKKILITVIIPIFSLVSCILVIIGGGGIYEYTNRIKDFFSGKSRIITTIIINPAHGGSDYGATAVHDINGRFMYFNEKDITLQLAMILRKKIGQIRPRINIVLTREEDISLTLDERTVISNSVPLKNGKTALFISLHVNYNSDQSARGYEVWYSTFVDGYFRQEIVNMRELNDDETLDRIFRKVSDNSLSTKTEAFANLLYVGLFENIYATKDRNRIREDEWFSLSHNRNVSVLLETGFLSNRSDAELLSNEDYLNKIADGIVTGIQYFEDYLSVKR